MAMKFYSLLTIYLVMQVTEWKYSNAVMRYDSLSNKVCLVFAGPVTNNVKSKAVHLYYVLLIMRPYSLTFGAPTKVGHYTLLQRWSVRSHLRSCLLCHIVV